MTSDGDDLPKTEINFDKEDTFFDLPENDAIIENEISNSESSSDQEEASSTNLTQLQAEMEA